MKLRWVTSHFSGNEPLPLLPLLPLAKEQARTLECLLWCLTASYLNYENTNQTDHQWSELRDYSLFMPGGRLARMRGGPRQIQQDSQRREGRSSINLHTKRGEGYLIFYFCFSFKQILSDLLGLTYMVCKPPKGEQFITGSLKLIKKTVTISTKWYVPIVRQQVFLVSFDPWGVPTTAMINNKVKLAVTSFDRITRQYFVLLPTDVCVDF